MTHTHEPAPCFNPHACEDSENPFEHAAPLWRAQPIEFWEYHRGDMESLARGAESAMRTMGTTTGDLDCMLVLLSTLQDRIPTYRRGERGEFFQFGPMLIPSSPRGMRTLSTLRTHARNFIVESSPLGLCAEDSKLGELTRALHGVSERSALVRSIQNETKADGAGFKFRLSTDARAFSALPKGEQAPPALLTPDMVGFVVEDPGEFQAECGMCEEGTIEFLREFDIAHDTEGGSYECCECGTEQADDEGETLCGVSSFTLTEEMVEGIISQGFEDKAREYIGAIDGGDNWSALLDTCDDAEILDKHTPDEKGIQYDPEVWEFSPDFEGIEGLEDLEWSEQARALPLLATIAARYAQAHTLPPIPGSLVLVRAAYESTGAYESTRARNLVWDPDSVRLKHLLGSGVFLEFNPLDGTIALVLDGQRERLDVKSDGLEFSCGGSHAGKRAQYLLATFQGKGLL